MPLATEEASSARPIPGQDRIRFVVSLLLPPPLGLCSPSFCLFASDSCPAHRSLLQPPHSWRRVQRQSEDAPGVGEEHGRRRGRREGRRGRGVGLRSFVRDATERSSFSAFNREKEARLSSSRLGFSASCSSLRSRTGSKRRCSPTYRRRELRERNKIECDGKCDEGSKNRCGGEYGQAIAREERSSRSEKSDVGEEEGGGGRAAVEDGSN